MSKIRIGSVYKVTNKITGDAYIGQTIQTRLERWAQYLYNAYHGSQAHFARAIRKYGPENFIVRTLKHVTEPLLNAAEVHFIARHDTFKNGYNMTKGGDGCGGYTHTKATRLKLSLLHKNIPESEESVWKRVAANTGKKRTTMFCQRMLQLALGRTLSVAVREKVSKTLLGRHLSKAHKMAIKVGCAHRKARGEEWHTSGGRARIAEAVRKRVWTDEMRSRVGAASKSHRGSVKTKEKRRASLKKFYTDHPERRRLISAQMSAREVKESTRDKLRATLWNSNRQPITNEVRAKLRAAWVRRKAC